MLMMIINDTENITESNRIKWLIKSFEYMVRLELMDVAIDLFEKYTTVFYMDKGHHMEDLTESLIACFEKSPALLELKIHLLEKWLPRLKYN
jgi:hypothetical protein